MDNEVKVFVKEILKEMDLQSEDNEYTMYRTFLKSLAVVLCIITLAIAQCSIKEKEAMRDSIASGANPMEVYCAYSSGEFATMRCNQLALTKVIK